MRARIVGPIITCFIGFFRREAGENTDLAFSRYTATSIVSG